jgi:heme oxygenase
LKEWLIANMASLGDEAIGVSSYSDKFWQRLGESMRTSPNTKLMHQVYLVDAVHETLAEMSDKQRRTGKLPGGSLLQKLYADHVLPKRGGNFVMVTT